MRLLWLLLLLAGCTPQFVTARIDPEQIRWLELRLACHKLTTVALVLVPQRQHFSPLTRVGFQQVVDDALPWCRRDVPPENWAEGLVKVEAAVAALGAILP